MIPLPRHPGLNQGLRAIKGVGPQIEAALKKKGFRVLGDLLGLMPSKFQDRRKLMPLGELVEDQEALTAGWIADVREGRFPKSGRRYFEMVIDDGNGQISALWFSFPAHLRHTLKKGIKVHLFGRVQSYKGRLQLVHPELIALTDEGRLTPEIRPVYPEIEGIRPGTLRRVMAQALLELAGLPTIFPKAWLEARDLTDPIVSLKTLHNPPADKGGPVPRPEASKAWRSLALFELFFLQLTLIRSRARQGGVPGWSFPAASAVVRDFMDGLPFKLTGSQKRVLEEIRLDMAAPRPMNRLLQGDVGSGKTVVALAAVFNAADGGRQAAIMAPTEILARQHFQTLHPHARRLGITAGLLVGSLAEADKRREREKLASGHTRIVVGTHALISESVEFASLGLVVIDEQHRFGVAQRLALRSKADHPDLLVMTATPIPRSLAMTLYGDLDLSIIRGLPPGRRPAQTKVFGVDRRSEAYKLLGREIAAGGQAYVVAPRIESREDPENPGEDLTAARDLHEFVKRDILPGIEVGLVHGRMKSDEQQRIMADFRSGRIRVLVATTVIEVGLDVAGATLVLIEGAEGFGLAQLHQLRGRVGRGERPAYCLFVAGQSGLDRLNILARTSDGFELAEEDLKIRGPGDTTGLKQSGFPPLHWAHLPRDLPLLLRARKLAEEMIAGDPELTDPSFKLVRDVVDQLDRRIQAELSDVG